MLNGRKECVLSRLTGALELSQFTVHAQFEGNQNRTHYQEVLSIA